MPVELTVEQRQIQDFRKRLKEHADGKALTREFNAAVQVAVGPSLAEVRSRVSVLVHVPTETRAQIAKKTKVAVRGGNTPGIRALVSRSASKGFTNAASAFNNPKGWRHRHWGSDKWSPQISSDPGFWEDSFAKHAKDIKAAVLQVVTDMANRIAGGT